MVRIIAEAVLAAAIGLGVAAGASPSVRAQVGATINQAARAAVDGLADLGARADTRVSASTEAQSLASGESSLDTDAGTGVDTRTNASLELGAQAGTENNTQAWDDGLTILGLNLLSSVKTGLGFGN